MRIVGYKRPLIGLGLALAAWTAPAHGQTVVGGDWRPQVEVDTSVLDRLGPEPTLPDMLLGRRPMAPAGAAVKLHRPHVAATNASATSAPKMAEANPPAGEPQHKVKTAKKAAAPAPATTVEKKPAKSTKMAAATLDLPAAPKPRASAVPANADMPSASDDAAAMTPPAVKAAPQQAKPSPAAEQPKQLASVEPPKVTPPPVTTTPAPQPAQPQAKAANDNPQPVTPAAPPAPQPKSAADAAPKADAPQKQALLTPAPATSGNEGSNPSLPFAKDSADISADARNVLMGAAKRASADQSIQIQVLAYASGDEDNSSKARRLSLTRALAVRSFLIDQGVSGNRIEVRALGNKVPEGPADRVDLVEQKH